jgi:hypothetical protein
MAKIEKMTVLCDRALADRIESERKRMEAETGLHRVPVSGAIVALIRRGLDASDRKAGRAK